MRIVTKIPISVGFIKESLGIKPSIADYKNYISAVCTDSREIIGGELFIGLIGEKHDGSRFINSVKNKAICSIGSLKSGADIEIKDPNASLLTLANCYKKLLPVRKTVAITGSVGKTTTKNLLASLLSSKFKVHSTYKNLNNEFGVPFTVFDSPADTEILVIEIGMNHLGEIKKASFSIEPDISVITKIGTAHIGNLHTRENIADAKCEILSGMTKPFALIPYNERLLSERVSSFKTVSTDKYRSDYCLLNDLSEKYFYNFKNESSVYRFFIPDIHRANFHIVECLAFALSVCCEMKMTEYEITDALQKIDFSSYSKLLTVGDLKIIDDSYNSSPEAVIEALKALSKTPGKKSALLGDMLELGDFSEELHFRIGEYASKCNLSKIYLIGKYAKNIFEGAVCAGFNKSEIFLNEDIENPELTAAQISEFSSNEVLLFKASRKIKLERIINILKRYKDDRL